MSLSVVKKNRKSVKLNSFNVHLQGVVFAVFRILWAQQMLWRTIRAPAGPTQHRQLAKHNF